MTPLETQLYNALRRMRRNDNLLVAAGGFFYLALSEADVALIMEAMIAYEDAATIARLREFAPVLSEGSPERSRRVEGPDDERALETAKRLANHK